MHRRLNRQSKLSCILLLVVSLCLLISTTVFADASKEQKTRQQLEAISSEMKELRQLLESFKSQRSGIQNDLQKSEVDIGKIKQKIQQLQKKLEYEQSELKTLGKKRDSLNKAKQGQQKFIQQQILAAYKIGQQKKIKILLNQESPEKISRTLTYYDYFNQARSDQIDNYVDIISNLNTIEPQIVEKTQQLQSAKNALSVEHKKLLSSKHQRQKNLDTINSSIKNKDQRLKKIRRDQREMEQLLKAVEQTIANLQIPSSYSPISSLKGKLPWPVNGKPSNRFGSRRNDSNMRWQGLTIQARQGSEVNSIHHGRIVFADWLRGSGLLIIIDHGDGYMSLYAHNESLLKEPGEWVDAGDIIATVGDSGGQKSAGLYFEIRHNGKPTDPKKWCKRV